MKTFREQPYRRRSFMLAKVWVRDTRGDPDIPISDSFALTFVPSELGPAQHPNFDVVPDIHRGD